MVQKSIKLNNVFHKPLLQLWSLHLEGWRKEIIINSKTFREQYNSLHLKQQRSVDQLWWVNLKDIPTCSREERPFFLPNSVISFNIIFFTPYKRWDLLFSSYPEMSGHQSCKSYIVACFWMNCIQLLKNSTGFLYLDFSGLRSG